MEAADADEVHDDVAPQGRRQGRRVMSLRAAMLMTGDDGVGGEEQALEAMQQAIRAHPESLWERDGAGLWPLHSAVLMRKPLSIIEFLVRAGPNTLQLRTDNELRLLPLHMAVVLLAPLEVIQFLVDAGPMDLLLQANGEGLVPLHIAAHSGRSSVKVIRCLTEACPRALQEPTRNDDQLLPLHIAASRGPPEAIEFLAKAYPPALRARSGDGRLPLQLVAKVRPFLPVVRCLLTLHPEAVRERSEDGRLPLHEEAAHGSSVEIVETLTQAWPHALCDKSASPADGGALPLHLAAGLEHPNAQVIAYLATRHPPALLEADEANGYLPLHRAAAAESESLDALQVLVKLCPAALKKKDKQGRVPLHLVAGRPSSHPGRVWCLADAWPWALLERDVNGQRPLHLAAENGAPLEVVRLLTHNYRRALLTPDAHGYLPIHHCAAVAAANGDLARALQVARFLAKEYPHGLRSPISWRSVPLAHVAKRGEPSLEVLQHLSEEVLPRDLRMPSSTAAIGAGGWLSCLLDALHDMVETVEFIVLILVEPPTLHLPCSDGRLPLHLAAERAASLEMVRYLASESPTALQVRDGKGCLPIHLAARRSAAQDSPTTAKDIVTFLAEAWPQGLLEASGESGWLPLHYAVGGPEASLEAIQILAEVAPTALDTPSKMGQLPLHWPFRSRGRRRWT